MVIYKTLFHFQPKKNENKKTFLHYLRNSSCCEKEFYFKEITVSKQMKSLDTNIDKNTDRNNKTYTKYRLFEGR